jgi:hypothetical protein
LKIWEIITKARTIDLSPKRLKPGTLNSSAHYRQTSCDVCVRLLLRNQTVQSCSRHLKPLETDRLKYKKWVSQSNSLPTWTKRYFSKLLNKYIFCSMWTNQLLRGNKAAFLKKLIFTNYNLPRLPLADLQKLPVKWPVWPEASASV